MSSTNQNVKTDASQSPKSSDHGEISKQVEFYFSDNNSPYDKFSWTETSKNEGWIPIKTIHSFKRMQRFQPYEEVVAALKESPKSLEVSEDGERVRRTTPSKRPAPQEGKDRFARTVYAKGFGDETPTSQFDIEEFFAKYGPVNQVRSRRTDDGTFKSSVFVEFTNEGDARKFVEQETKPKFGEHELEVMSKQAYVEMKSEQHNFADRANGRRKPKFNAFKEMQAQENRQRRNNGRRSNNRNKRRAEDDGFEAKRARTEGADSAEPKAEETVEEPKAEAKSEELKAETKSEEPKAEAKSEEPKAEAKSEEKPAQTASEKQE